MKIWIDAQLSPQLAEWLNKNFSVQAIHVRDLGLRDAKDQEIFNAAKVKQAVIMTKDIDFSEILTRKGSPPQILWITCGNTSNKYLKHILKEVLFESINLLKSGEDLVEISDALKSNI